MCLLKISACSCVLEGDYLLAHCTFQWTQLAGWWLPGNPEHPLNPPNAVQEIMSYRQTTLEINQRPLDSMTINIESINIMLLHDFLIYKYFLEYYLT